MRAESRVKELGKLKPVRKELGEKEIGQKEVPERNSAGSLLRLRLKILNSRGPTPLGEIMYLR